MTVERACAFVDAAAHLRALSGLAVAQPWKGYGSAIFLELGRLTPEEPDGRSHREGESCIAIEWDWRVEHLGSVLYGSSNTRPEILRGIESLQGTAIDRIDIVGDVPELVVNFSNGHCMRTMVMVDGDPQWSIKLSQAGEWLYPRRGALFIGDGREPIDEAQQTSFDVAREVAFRWDVPSVSPVVGRCADCRWFKSLDGDGHLLDYGVCIAASGPLDGRAVHRKSGCPAFVAGEDS